MAFRRLTDDDEMQQATNGPAAPVAAPVAGAAPAMTPTASAAPTPAPSRYVGFQQYLNANQPAVDRSVQKVAGAVDAAGQDAQRQTAAVQRDASGLAPGLSTGGMLSNYRGTETPASGAESSLYPGAAQAVQNAQTLAANTATTGGLQTALGTGSGGAGRFDAGLVGVAGGDRFEAQRSRYAGLQAALDGAAQTRRPEHLNPAPPAAPAGPGFEAIRLPAGGGSALRAPGGVTRDPRNGNETQWTGPAWARRRLP